MKKLRHLLSITDLKGGEILKIISMAKKLKKWPTSKQSSLLKNEVMAMIFEKPSLRTRVSFEAGMTQLGGHAIYLAPGDIGLGKREAIGDVSLVLSRMADIIMARTFSHSTVIELARYSRVPVINALSDTEHPCQILADILTIYEKKKRLKGLNIAFVGDGENNVTHSLGLASAVLGINFSVASPKHFVMNKSITKKIKDLAMVSGAKIYETRDPKTAVTDADIVYTDTWVSMGDEKEAEKRFKIFKDYQVDSRLMNYAKNDAIFMHDMPAYRGKEVSASVIDGKSSVVIDQAENRLHAQKALICFLLGINI